MRWALVVALSMFVAACESEASISAQPAPSSTSSVAIPDAAPAAPVHRASEALLRCASRSGELASVADAVARLNALAAPVDGPCFVATLPRPLSVVATTGRTSAQPAAGPSSPRLFFLLPRLVISAVPAGEGSKVLEVGEWVSATRTLKGEIGLPVTAPLAPDAPFKRVLVGDAGTVCATCHRGEEPSASTAGAYSSVAFKPGLGTFITVSELERLHSVCTRESETTERCAMLHAVFDFGEVRSGAFAAEVETFNP